ncbi:MAG: hypothetical protein U0Y68_13985 [Blastocatellia bacterium]
MDARTDLFSLGVVLYELATGQLPFDGETPSDVLAAILKSEPADTDGLPVARCLSAYCCAGVTQRTQCALPVGGGNVARPARVAAASELATPTPRPHPLLPPTRALPVRTQSSAEYLVNEIKRHKLGVSAVLLALLLNVALVYLFVVRTTSPCQRR